MVKGKDWRRHLESDSPHGMLCGGRGMFHSWLVVTPFAAPFNPPWVYVEPHLTWAVPRQWQCVAGCDRGILTGSFLEGCGVPLLDSFGLRTLHGFDWNFLRTVLLRSFAYLLPSPSFPGLDLPLVWWLSHSWLLHSFQHSGVYILVSASWRTQN